MAHSILLTGASGYLGGTFLARLKRDQLPEHRAIYVLVRSREQEEAVKKYGVQPLYIDLDSDDDVVRSITENKITVVFFLIDAAKQDRQVRLIKALATVRKQTGLDTHFLHTSGAKVFSEHAGLPTDRVLEDDDPNLFELQMISRASAQLAAMNDARETNNAIIDVADKYGVKSYIFIPCIVYGEGEGFGNRISIQTVAIVRAAKGVRRVYDVNNSKTAIWPVRNILDNTALYRDILRTILYGSDIGHGRNGYYLAATGSVAWCDLYAAMAKSLAQLGIVEDDEVGIADEGVLEKMGDALHCSKQAVRVQLGGCCMLEAKHGASVGWKPQYKPQHILDTADAEVKLILAHL